MTPLPQDARCSHLDQSWSHDAVYRGDQLPFTPRKVLGWDHCCIMFPRPHQDHTCSDDAFYRGYQPPTTSGEGLGRHHFCMVQMSPMPHQDQPWSDDAVSREYQLPATSREGLVRHHCCMEQVSPQPHQDQPRQKGCVTARQETSPVLPVISYKLRPLQSRGTRGNQNTDCSRHVGDQDEYIQELPTLFRRSLEPWNEPWILWSTFFTCLWICFISKITPY